VSDFVDLHYKVLFSNQQAFSLVHKQKGEKKVLKALMPSTT
jgi:hypothetical protein